VTRLGRFVPELLREREFRWFWLGQTISVFGDQITLLAIPIVAVLILDADPAAMGLLTAAGLLPHLLFSLPAGVWLDRVQRRRRLMILTDIARAAVIAVIPLAFLGNWLSLELLFVVTFLVGTLSVAFDISWLTLFSAVARREQFVQANSLLSGSRSISFIGGPAIGGILIQLLSAPVTLLLDALSFLGSAFFLGKIRATEPPIERDPGSIRTQLATGLSFIARDSIIRGILLSVGTVNFFNYCFAALFILYVTTFLQIDPGVLGLALGAGAVGSVIGAVIAARVGRRLGVGRAYLLGLVLFPAPLILVPLASGLMEVVLPLLFLAELGSGMGVMILDINASAMLQSRTPNRIRGRSGGAFRFINMGIRPIGATVGGLLGAAFGVRETLFVVAAAQLLGALWLIGSPVLRLREMPKPAGEDDAEAAGADEAGADEAGADEAGAEDPTAAPDAEAAGKER
jgi:MFS family permease